MLQTHGRRGVEECQKEQEQCFRAKLCYSSSVIIHHLNRTRTWGQDQLLTPQIFSLFLSLHKIYGITELRKIMMNCEEIRILKDLITCLKVLF
jgi:hypothetical protein